MSSCLCSPPAWCRGLGQLSPPGPPVSSVGSLEEGCCSCLAWSRITVCHDCPLYSPALLAPPAATPVTDQAQSSLGAVGGSPILPWVPTQSFPIQSTTSKEASGAISQLRQNWEGVVMSGQVSYRSEHLGKGRSAVYVLCPGLPHLSENQYSLSVITHQNYLQGLPKAKAFP